jgi:hypothetical protein
MKTSLIQRSTAGLGAALLLSSASIQAAVTVDGVRDGSDIGYAEVTVQAHNSAWGGGNTLANMHAAQTDKLLNLFIAGRANDNAIILFIDSKPGGGTTITKDLIRSGDLEVDINHLAPDSGTGMTFESGFQPDHAIRIYGNGSAAYASHFDLVKRIRIDLGQVDNATASHGPVAALRVNWADATIPYANFANGVEMALNMALLGVPEGSQDVKVMAILVNKFSTYGSNQTLGSLDTNAELAGGVRTFDFGSETTTQHQTISVIRPTLVPGDDEDGDGIINSSDTDPLDPTRAVIFRVNMRVQYAKGAFDPPSQVQVRFFTGSQAEFSSLTLTDPDSDLIYVGYLYDVKGFTGDSFGTYKFITNDPQSPNSGYEYGYDRTFNLAGPGTDQIPGTVFFGDQSTLTFTEWASGNAGGQAADADTDGDGMDNALEYFMGSNNSQFTANPQPVGGVISWPRDPAAVDATPTVWISANLTDWTPGTADTSDPNFLKFTLTPDGPKKFVRLGVTVP